MDFQIQEPQRLHTDMYWNQIVKTQKQRKNFESRGKRKRLLMYKGTPMELSVYFSAEILQDKKNGNVILKALQEKYCHPKYYNW